MVEILLRLFSFKRPEINAFVHSHSSVEFVRAVGECAPLNVPPFISEARLRADGSQVAGNKTSDCQFYGERPGAACRR